MNLEIGVTVRFDGREFDVCLPCDDLEEDIIEALENANIIDENWGTDEDFDIGEVISEILELKITINDLAITEFEDADLIKLDKLLKNCDTLEEINDKITEINEMLEDISNVNVIKAVMNGGYGDFEKAVDDISCERVGIRENVYSEIDFAREHVEEIGSWAGVEIPHNSNLWFYLDWEQISKEIFMDGLYYDEETNIVVDFNY